MNNFLKFIFSKKKEFKEPQQTSRSTSLTRGGGGNSLSLSKSKKTPDKLCLSLRVEPKPRFLLLTIINCVSNIDNNSLINLFLIFVCRRYDSDLGKNSISKNNSSK